MNSTAGTCSSRNFYSFLPFRDVLFGCTYPRRAIHFRNDISQSRCIRTGDGDNYDLKRWMRCESASTLWWREIMKLCEFTVIDKMLYACSAGLVNDIIIAERGWHELFGRRGALELLYCRSSIIIKSNVWPCWVVLSWISLFAVGTIFPPTFDNGRPFLLSLPDHKQVWLRRNASKLLVCVHANYSIFSAVTDLLVGLEAARFAGCDKFPRWSSKEMANFRTLVRLFLHLI